MKDLRKLFYLLLIIPILFVQTGCSEDDPVDPPAAINEAEVLATHIVATNNPLSSHTQNTMIKATAVHTNLTTGANQYVIDVRSATDYAAGHIEGAVHVDQKEVLAHYEANSLGSKEVVVIACYSGQTACWVTSLMHMAGHTNVRDLKWGMCSWNDDTATKWKSNTTGSYSSSGFVKTATQKPEKGSLPELSTGKTTGADILRVRVEAVFAEGFGAAKVANNSIDNHFIANYWNIDDYNWGHIDGAMQYSPKDAFTIDADLKTLPTNKKIAVYCYTGQTSALVSAYLRVLGYDAQSVLYGVNAIAYNDMPGTRFIKDANDSKYDIHDYPLVQ